MTTGSYSLRGALGLLGLAALLACQAEVEAPAARPVDSADTATPAAVATPASRSFANARSTLTLFDDFSYRLRESVSDGSAAAEYSYDLGRWSRAQDDGDRLRLDGGREAPALFRFLAADSIKQLSNEGAELTEPPLRRLAELDRIVGPMRLLGQYRYMADAAVFAECLTGNRYPVLIEAAHLPLERAYLQQRGEPGAPILASFEAEFVLRAPEPGLPLREHLRITAFDRLLPGQVCPPSVGGPDSK